MFVIDSSEDTGPLLLEQQKRLTLGLSTELARLQSSAQRLRLRLAALQYDRVVSTRHNFRDWQDLDVFQSRVASMSPSGRRGGSASRLADALGNATRLFARETAAGSLRVLLLMLDGSQRPSSATWAAAEARRHNIRVFAIRTQGVASSSPAPSPPQPQYVHSLADSRLQDDLLEELVSVGGRGGRSIMCVVPSFSLIVVLLFQNTIVKLGVSQLPVIISVLDTSD